MNFTIRNKLILSYIVLVVITALMATVAATYINSQQIIARNQERLQNAFRSVERQIDEDIRFLNNKFKQLRGNELFEDIIISGGDFDVMTDNVITTFSIFPKVRQYLLDFGMNQGVEHYAIYYFSDNQPNARLMIQAIPELGGIVINGSSLMVWNSKAYFEKKDIKFTQIFPEIHLKGTSVEISKFKGKAGLGVSHELFLPKFGSSNSQDKFDKAGYILLRNAFSFNLDTQNRDLGVEISIFDIEGKLIGGNINLSDIGVGSSEVSNKVITLMDKTGDTFDSVMKPIVYREKQIGYIAVSLPQTDTTNQIWQTLSILYLFCLGVVVVVTIIAIFSAARITRPIVMLASRAKRINMDNLGDFKTVIPVSGNNELTVLSEAFSSMVKNLLQARHHLDKSLENLKRIAKEGHKISSSSGYSILQNEVRKSFSVLSDNKINAELVFSGQLFKNRNPETFYHVGHDDQSSVEVRPRSKELDLTGTNYFDVLDNKEDTCLAQLRLDSIELGKSELDSIIPFYRPLLINIANTIKNISMVKEIQSNLTVLKQKNQELKDLNHHKDEFLANTSHELRTPLNGIIGISESLLDMTSGTINEEQAHNLKLIIQSGKNLLQLINDILDYSKMKHRELQLNCGKVTLKVILSEVLNVLSLDASEKKLELKYQIPPRIPEVFADENRVQQILYNLIGNAIKFTSSGFVTITASEENEFIKISVKDSGIGIEPSQIQNLFQPFEQIDGSVEKEFKGTGLGLSISKNLVEMHGGSISVESIENFGSVFSFTLPIFKEEVVSNQSTLASLKTNIDSDNIEEIVIVGSQDIKDQIRFSDQKQEEPEKQEYSASSTILIVDDEIINIQVLKNHFKNKGYRVLQAQDGISALEIVETEEIDLMLLDLMMPKMSGYDVCSAIRKTHTMNELPVIILTAKNQISDLIQAYQCGANDYITKPFFKEEILVRVKAQLAIKESIDNLKEVEQLRSEIEKRTLAEQSELIAKRRLIRILDLFEKAIIAVDKNFEFLFFNQKAEELFEYTSKSISGKSLKSIFPDEDFADWLKLTNPNQDEISNSQAGIFSNINGKTKSQKTIAINAHISQVDSQEDLCFVIICDTSSALEVKALQGALKGVESLISKNNHTIINEVRGIDASLDDLKVIINEDQYGLDIRNAIVNMMFLAVQYWENSTGKSKLDLAEESNLWKVYFDNGSYRTRTLDRYLFLSTLPQKPRWRTAISTAFYVLANCPEIEPLKTELVNSRDKLQTLLSR